MLASFAIANIHESTHGRRWLPLPTVRHTQPMHEVGTHGAQQPALATSCGWGGRLRWRTARGCARGGRALRMVDVSVGAIEKLRRNEHGGGGGKAGRGAALPPLSSLAS